MSEPDIKLTVELPFLKVDEKIIRYFTLSCGASHAFAPNGTFHRDCVPLFLGADVLKNCGAYAVKNLGRVHSKFASEGLATKISFPAPSCRLKGIRGTGEKIWFYSIQGLFKVAFDYYQRKEQKELLEKCQRMWILRVGDTPLSQEISLTKLEQLSLMPSSEFASVTCDIACPQDKVDDVPQDPQVRIDDNPQGPEVLIDNNPQGPQVIIDGVPQDPQHKIDDVPQDPQHKIDDVPQDQGIGCKVTANCSGKHCPTNYTTDRAQHYCEKLQGLLKEIFQHYDNGDDTNCDIILSYLESFIMLCIHEKENIVSRKSTAFPIKLIKDYLELKSQSLSDYQDEELAIHILSSWLGEKFKVFKSIIKQNVDKFKQNYIDSIQELPQSEEIIKELYPSAMYSLLYLWIRGPEIEDESDDHQMGTKQAVSLCLLALELLNNQPVTGVGHYVYSLLQHSSVSH
eukprot:gene14264-15751_t